MVEVAVSPAITVRVGGQIGPAVQISGCRTLRGGGAVVTHVLAGILYPPLHPTVQVPHGLISPPSPICSGAQFRANRRTPALNVLPSFSPPLIAQVPTFRANGRTSALNVLAGQLGDDRAAGVRRKYGRPFKAIVILGTGVLLVQ